MINITSIFQLSILGLIVLSFIMIIAVPVLFALPNGWVNNKNYVFLGATAWASLVFLVGALNFVIV